MGSLKLIFGLFTIVAVVYLTAELAPPFFANYQFEDVIKTEAQMGTYSNRSDDALRDEVYKKALELDVPIAKDQIERTRRCVAAGVAAAATLDAANIVQTAQRLLEDEPRRAALAERAAHLKLADGVEVAIQALGGLVESARRAAQP